MPTARSDRRAVRAGRAVFLALASEERAQVREALNSPRFQDMAPRQVWAQLLDEGRDPSQNTGHTEAQR